MEEADAAIVSEDSLGEEDFRELRSLKPPSVVVATTTNKVCGGGGSSSPNNKKKKNKELTTLLASPRTLPPTDRSGSGSSGFFTGGPNEACPSAGELPPLEPLSTIAQKREEYRGPTDESNWVIPGKLMVGAYPGSVDDRENDRVLESILDENVTTFVCLQREYDPKAREADWRGGDALRPYFSSAVDLAERRRHSMGSPQGRPPKTLTFLHFPIEDCSVGEDSAVTAFAKRLADVVREDVVYMHCWGGHGRAGTLACLLLHILYGLDDVAAMRRCQFVHDTRRVPIDVGSPQTQRQRDQVSRVIRKLSSSAAKKTKPLLVGGAAEAPPHHQRLPPASSSSSSGKHVRSESNESEEDDAALGLEHSSADNDPHDLLVGDEDAAVKPRRPSVKKNRSSPLGGRAQLRRQPTKPASPKSPRQQRPHLTSRKLNATAVYA